MLRFAHNNADINALLAENALLRGEIRCAREASDIAASMVVQQFEAADGLISRFHQTSARLQAVLDAAKHIAVIACTLDGIIELFSRGAEHLLGIPAAEVIGRLTPLHFFDPEELAARCRELSSDLGRPVEGLALFSLMVRHGRTEAQEWTYMRADGARVPVSLSVTGLPDPEGGFSGFLGVAMDLTQIKQAEQRLAAQTAVLEATLDNVDQGISMFGHDLHLMAWNRRFVELLDLPPELIVVGLPMVELLRHNALRGEYGPGPVDVLVEERLAAARRMEPHCFERRRVDGTILEIRGQPIGNGGGFVTTYTDITGRKLDEDRLREANQELAEAIDRLQELDRLKSDFLSTVSHELRTPLTSIRGFAQLVLRDFERVFAPLAADAKTTARAERIRENLAIMLNEGDRLGRLINDVLDLAKIESGRVDWHDDSVGAAQLVSQAAAAARGMFAARPEISFSVAVDDDAPMVKVDSGRIQQVILNLIGNAEKFTTAGSVTLRAQRTAAGNLAISVADTGSGFPPDKAEAVFDRFQQISDVLIDKPAGTGLGLSICREIVEHYGGRIWAESTPGVGSVFTFTLPATVATAAAEKEGKHAVGVS